MGEILFAQSHQFLGVLPDSMAISCDRTDSQNFDVMNAAIGAIAPILLDIKLVVMRLLRSHQSD